MKFDDLIALANSATKLVKATGLVPNVVELAEAVTEIVAVIQRNIDEGHAALAATEISQLNAILEPLHARVLTLSQRLDSAAEAASKR